MGHLPSRHSHFSASFSQLENDNDNSAIVANNVYENTLFMTAATFPPPKKMWGPNTSSIAVVIIENQ